MQSTKSSLAVFFRAVVMLAFLAAIPIVALCGNSLPDGARRFVGRWLPQFADPAPAASSNLREAPPFRGSAAERPVPLMAAAAAPTAAPDLLPTGKEPSVAPMFPQSGRAGDGAPPPGEPVVPANYQVPVETAATLDSSPDAPSSKDLFTKIQERLRTLGATYYLLETWGNQQQLYRFYCQMAVAGGSNYTHCFESTSQDPLHAMQDVLRQVEAWRGNAPE